MFERSRASDERVGRDVSVCLGRIQQPVYCSDFATKGAARGAYALLVRLDASVTLRVGRLGKCRFSAGYYAYGGSARGSGGIGARLRRHMRPEKRIHWHIDHLTTSAHIVAAWALPGGSECDVVDAFLSMDQSGVPVAGFGASDCTRCRAHLVRLEGPET